MTDTEHLPVLVVRHVAWEGPHRILRAFDDRAGTRGHGSAESAGRPAVHLVDALAPGAALPPVDTVAGAVFMGGPMSANDTDALPPLAAEIAWLRQAIAADVPVLGICLGAQLIARALGARVYPASVKELGWAPVDILDDTDPLLGTLAPRRTVLHWHGEIFDPPPGAVVLARSAQTACQAFRVGSAWAVLFHPEADRHLVDAWLAEPSMAAEAEQVLGPTAAHTLRGDAHAAELELLTASAEMFAAFAARLAARADMYGAGSTA